eukprot:gnl/TRDRNA2_/TRDRNA2_196154_c0_seq1.p1 gnl/TRDRNA2_/TRDRNA2_196154_c0~~gnl/TRDRNA2_/TRDRNA2_196154_c0_seq1.p1  ORF type:complete len:168 (-),score=33.51 gnl/TRDRNA2_/TRDRNA2_196154_c0_seq1:5-508(-)
MEAVEESAKASSFATVFVAVLSVVFIMFGGMFFVLRRLNAASRAQRPTKRTFGRFEKEAAGLLEAAASGNAVACKLAVEATPQHVEACNADGQTALILAARQGHFDVCRLLLAARADVEATDGLQRTPLSYAAMGKHQETCRLLLDHGADIEATDCVVRDYGGCFIL